MRGSSAVAKIKTLKNHETWIKKEDIRVHDSAFSRLNVIKGKLMFVILKTY